jgi:hypothetical protein
VDGRFGRARGNLLAALVAIPVGLLEPVEAARERGETDADEAEDGTGETVVALVSNLLRTYLLVEKQIATSERATICCRTYNWRASPFFSTFVRARCWHI